MLCLKTLTLDEITESAIAKDVKKKVLSTSSSLSMSSLAP